MQDSSPASSPTPTTWGRSRLGSGRLPAMAIAIPAGLVLALLSGTAFALVGPYRDPSLLTFVTFALSTLAPWIALIYAVVVDRTTIKGATRFPERSIESQWYERAATGALQDSVTVLGIGAIVTAFGGWSMPINGVLFAILLFIMASFGIRYLTASKRG